ncbi:hypothetical protein JVX91_05920 [Pseudomonas sp. PDNC002]|uniref:hypothetical protein n=1 Tax=Pseudomonas sp. PDNC002 TaxID=2811422 RepID=UPI0019651C00|nr:hypothetical protein [Pseudomonas sp. PDNC002]QRY80640.1 hypothetical protein JVX91_05920 [Pseudomonas sp. PDNC002]
MKYLILPSLLLALATSASAAFHVEPIKATHPNGSEYRFPLLTDKNEAAANINTWLQAVSLQKLPGRYGKSAFEDIWPEGDDGWQGVTSMDFQLVSDEPGYLSMDIAYEYMSAYPSQHTTTYNFDAHTGQPIQLRDLFTPDGQQWLRLQASQARVKRIEGFLTGNLPEKDLRLRSDPEEAQEQKHIYENCLPYVRDDDLSYNDLVLGKDALTLVRELCAPHVVQALDDLGEYSNSWKYTELTRYLSDYGRCLLVEKHTDCAPDPARLSAGVSRGKLDGRYPIILVLENENSDGTVSGAYFYEKYARYISLSGKRDAQGNLVLREAGPPPALFSLTPSASGLSGTWQQEGQKSLPIDLH